MPGADPYKGHAAQIAIAMESAQGVTEAPTRHLAKLEEETQHADPSVNWYEERLIGGNREMSGKHPGQRVYEGGSYPVVMVDGVPLALLFGNEEYDDGGEDGTPTHTFTPRMDGRPPTATVEATQYGRGGGDDFVRTFGGVAATSGEIGTDTDSKLTCTLSTLALGVTPGSNPTDVGPTPDADPWLFSDISSNFSFAGTEFARLEDFVLGVDNQMTPKHYIEASTAPDPYEILYGNVAYDLAASITIDDDTLYQELVSPTGGGVTASIAFTRSNGDVLTITAEGVNLGEVPTPTPRGDDESVLVEGSLIPERLSVEMDDSYATGAILA